ncbi:FKBP-type peptidyl-prolyl cis-trans isomerase [Pseudobdellovibrio exovorus]|uniref:Peptidyl-prolyl cis-trans isomerase n=1 Tax=Pseudobdellovibrio exovorus JSS TaxID=1184267 RepID=M4VB03_9BACT|nr:FKBP-type peptidyl-prolyl cis-trans isomerase [Pseudobdellovibrio exovorus]AGH96398.1 FKBP-type peptidyl-prolyl cis-trans isomerase [Pseudobdellovibrio exovorus JSS]
MSETRVIAFNYVLKNAQGELIDASEPNQPMPFLEGKQQIIPALEAVLVKMTEGDKQQVTLAAKDAYGDFRQDMIMEVPKEELAHLKIDVGSHLQLQLQNQVKVVKVTKIGDTHVTLDGNHPLAGVDLVFDVEVMLIRLATAEEIQHGHAHGLHGHAHHH